MAWLRQALHESLRETPGECSFAKAKTSSQLEELQAFLDEAVADCTEGLMVKAMDATYEPSKRSLNWLKLKKDYMEGAADSFDVVPIGAWWGPTPAAFARKAADTPTPIPAASACTLLSPLAPLWRQVWQRQAHRLLRLLPPGHLRFAVRNVPDHQQDRDGLQRGGAGGALGQAEGVCYPGASQLLQVPPSPLFSSTISSPYTFIPINLLH